MGGLGSGNRYHSWRDPKKGVVEDCLKLDANRWKREGILGAGVRSGRWRWTYASGSAFSLSYDVDAQDPANATVRLSYAWVWTSTQQRESADYRVRLATTRQRNGGLRWWFLCPLRVNGVPCGRRVAKLYLPRLGRYFGCRTCHKLTYTSCQESRKHDSLYRFMARQTGEDFEAVKRAMRFTRKRR